MTRTLFIVLQMAAYLEVEIGQKNRYDWSHFQITGDRSLPTVDCVNPGGFEKLSQNPGTSRGIREGWHVCIV